MRIPLAKLWADNLRVLAQTAVNHHARCMEYSLLTTPMPAISVRQGAQTIIYDGHHRTVAASFRGDTEIDVVLVF
jgi:hypothetical protein